VKRLTKFSFIFLFLFLMFLASPALAENPYENISLTNETPVQVMNPNFINLTSPDSEGHYDYVEIAGNTHISHFGRLTFSTSPYVITSDGQTINSIDGLSWVDQLQLLAHQYDNSLTTSDDTGNIQLENNYYQSFIKENLVIAKPVQEIGYNFNAHLIDWDTLNYDPINNTTQQVTSFAKDSRIDISIDEYGNAVVCINGANTLVLPAPIATDSEGKIYKLYWFLDNSNKILKIGNLYLLNQASYPIDIDPSQLITNGGFETGNLLGWTQNNAVSGGSSIVTNNVHSGTYACRIDTNSQGVQYYENAIQQTFNVTVGSTCSVYVNCTASESTSGFTGAYLLFGSNLYHTYVNNYWYNYNNTSLTTSGQGLNLGTYSFYFTNTAYYDDASVYGASNSVTSYNFGNQSGPTSQTFNWTCPAGIYNIDLNLIGSGGTGGSGGFGSLSYLGGFSSFIAGIWLPVGGYSAANPPPTIIIDEVKKAACDELIQNDVLTQAEADAFLAEGATVTAAATTLTLKAYAGLAAGLAIVVSPSYYHGGGGGGGGSGNNYIGKLAVTPGQTYTLTIDSTSSRIALNGSTLAFSNAGGSGQQGSDATGGTNLFYQVGIFGGNDGTGGQGGSADGLQGASGGPGGNGGNGVLGKDGVIYGRGGKGGKGGYGYPDIDYVLQFQNGNYNPNTFNRYNGDYGTLGHIFISYAANNATYYAPSASFTSNVSSGIAPLTVQFNDTSIGIPTAWNWNYGDGQSATTQNPTHTYNTPGSYQVTLSVTNTQGTDATPPGYKTITVTTGSTNTTGGGNNYNNTTGIYGKVAFIGSPLNGNSPLTVGFQDLSSNSPTSFKWDFGDGLTSNTENPTHTYLNAGVYDVKFDAINASGDNWLTRSTYITVKSPTVVNAYLTPLWHASPISGLPGTSVQFTEDTSGASSRTWDFGDGQTSTATNPSHTYNNAGLYDVKYSATNTTGTVWLNRTGYININPRIPVYPVPDFRANPTTGLNPLQVSFIDYSIGNPTSWYWDFGDGQASTSENPTHTYSTVGTYNVKLQATNANGSLWMNKTGLISAYNFQPQAIFTASPVSGNSPLVVSFTDKSTNGGSNNQINAWYWDFGDGSSSTQQSPTHSYNVAGSYSVKHQVTSASGSSWVNYTHYISVQTPPIAQFYGTPLSGNAPLNVGFYDMSQNGATSWYWTFGDGGTSNVQNPNHIYTSSGAYNVNLTATNAFGSSTVSKLNYVAVQTPPVANFSASPTGGNSPLAVSFVDTSFGGPTSWSWTFGDGNTSTSKYPTHTYYGTGSYNVGLTATNAYGSNTLTKNSFIQVNVPPTASFTGNPLSGNYPLIVSFTDTSFGGPTSWLWNFGDSSSSTLQNPVHTYSTAGTYTVTLQVTNAYGASPAIYTNYITVTTPALNTPVANFIGSPTSGNAPLQVTFTDQSTGNPTSWLWSFGDGNTSTAQSPFYTYTNAGTYAVSLRASNTLGQSTATKQNYITVGNGASNPVPSPNPNSPGPSGDIHNSIDTTLQGFQPIAAGFTGFLIIFWLMKYLSVVFM
jgi:PKD repeat protein